MMPSRHSLKPILALSAALVGCAPTAFDNPDGSTPTTDCNAYDFRGTTYDCSALDRCTETDLVYRLACCECDVALCNPDPTCDETDGGRPPPTGAAESCMQCHNGSDHNDYAGEGMSNPHPFPGMPNILCTECHGGNPNGVGRLGSHVPAPPEIGDDDNLILDPGAYFNYLTLSGIDNIPDYTVDGVTYTALEWLQFMNPGDLRVVQDGEGCGTPGCHAGEHAEWVPRNAIGNAVGFFSGVAYAAGIENHIPEQQGLWEDTAAEWGWRALSDADWAGSSDRVGSVGRVDELPERAVYGDRSGIYQNALYDSTQLPNYLYDGTIRGYEANRVVEGSPLEHVLFEAVGVTCGDCHLGSRGANNRYGDFRSSGCTACHMEYSTDGRSRSTDPNVNHTEPADPDAIAAPERSHIDSHQIRNVARTLPNGAFVRGISDYACAGCHQGSNRTVMQFWGIRLDQNADVVNNRQYPENPANFQNTAGDDRLFDPAVGNNTFNGRNADQYLLVEDYDNDNRDDTPADLHHEAGLGCIDCHGSRDLHGGTRGDDTSGRIVSRMDESVQIECQSCHGGVSNYAATIPCRTYQGDMADCALDRAGNPLRHVTQDAEGNFFLISRLNGSRHFIPQVRDVTVDNGMRNPLTREAVFNPIGSYAMGRADGSPTTGTGPLQGDPTLVTDGFSHTDRLDCAACHASWTNNCVGCHLANEYDADPAHYFFSNLTGERIVQAQANADFTYITPVPFYLGVNARGRVTQMSSGTQLFYRYFDLNGVESQVFAFSDRQGNGNNPNDLGRDAHGALSFDAMMPHSIRGRVTGNAEGPRYCVACHLTTDAIDTFGAQYAAFRANMANRNYAALDFNLLRQHIGQNPGNQLNSPFWVHMVAGLGSGLFLFDDTGCPENPLDDFAGRAYCPDGAPARTFNANDVTYNLDGLVEPTGVSNAATAHPATDPARVAELRRGSLNAGTSGPLGVEILQLLTDPDNGLVLDSWIDADGQPQGNAAAYVAR
ncbi:MAG: hypothetical protein KC619_02885 [Myxococcales bacterium]|nr:hypothetical protein [Myxococcales bacterium]